MSGVLDSEFLYGAEIRGDKGETGISSISYSRGMPSSWMELDGLAIFALEKNL